MNQLVHTAMWEKKEHDDLSPVKWSVRDFLKSAYQELIMTLLHIRSPISRYIFWGLISEKYCAYRKEGRFGVLCRLQLLRSYRDENQKEIPFSSRIVPRSLSVAEGP